MPEILKNISKVKLRMRRGAVVFGDVIYSPGGICGPRIQSDFQLVLMHEGELNLKLDDQRIEVPARHAILLGPGHREHFRFSKNQDTHHSWCSVDPEAIPQKLRRLLKPTGVPAPLDLRLAALMELGKTTVFEGHSDSSLENTFHLSLGLALLAGFALGAQAAPPALSPGDEALARAEQFIATQYARPLRLADLASAARVSRQHLLKLFQQRRGTTATQCLYERRLSVAADQLIHTGLSVRQIAGDCGFANEFHFSRKFKEAYALSPRLWRTKHWMHPTRRLGRAEN
jgi:AraC-like DNA-binding protein